MPFVADKKNWVDSISPTLWFKLELLSKGEVWVLDDPEFLNTLEELMQKISIQGNFLGNLIGSDHFPKLVQALAVMDAALMLRLCSLASPGLMFEPTLIQWCSEHLSDRDLKPYCNVLISRFDWLIQQDLNNRIFGINTRLKVSKILANLSSRQF